MNTCPPLTHSPRRFWRLALTVLLAALALLAFAGLTRTAAQGVEMVYFTGCSDNTGNNATVLIPATAPQIHTAGYFLPVPGDEFAVFRPTAGVCSPAPSLCAGALVWQGSDDALTVWGDNTAVGGVDGMLSNELMCWRVWDASQNKVYTATVVYENEPPFDGSGRYSANGIYALQTLSPTALKLTAFQAVSHAVRDHRSALLAGCALLLAAAGLLVATKLLPRGRKQIV